MVREGDVDANQSDEPLVSTLLMVRYRLQILQNSCRGFHKRHETLKVTPEFIDIADLEKHKKLALLGESTPTSKLIKISGKIYERLIQNISLDIGRIELRLTRYRWHVLKLLGTGKFDRGLVRWL